MPSEVTRYQLARSPVRACIDEKLPPLRVESWLVDSELMNALLGVVASDRRDVAERFGLNRAPLTSLADSNLELDHGVQLAELDQWLTCSENQPEPDDLKEAVKRILDREVARRPTAETFDPGDRLYQDARRLAEFLVLASILGTAPTNQRTVFRGLLIVGLVERLLLAFGSLDSPGRILEFLRDRLVLLPKSVFPLPYRAAVARRPGFADLHVVRQEWNRYEAGEIAHIENVLPGELKRRVLTRTDETETTETTETERTRLTERDVQSTSRFELSDETSSDTTTLVHVEGEVDTSGQYGPTKVDTHLGGSLDFSKEESEQHATTQATEIVARAVSRVEERVREERVVRSLTRTVDRNFHELNNDSAEAVVGMYRWVDKVVRLQRFLYPHRYLLEFQVPEPAAYLRWLEQRNADRGFSAPAPVAFTLNGEPVEDANPTLLPTDISENPLDAGYYLNLTARWSAIGINAPPPPETVVNGWLHIPATDPAQDKTSHDVWISPSEASPSATGEAGGVEGQSITIPDGYEAADNWSGWISAWDQDDAIRPAWNPPVEKGQDRPSHLYAPPQAYVTVGDSQNDPAVAGEARNIATNARSAISKPIGGELKGRTTGLLPITVLNSNYGMMSVEVRVRCVRRSALLAWQLDTYETLRAAYFEMLRAHEEERSARSVQAGVTIEGRSPLENARIVREELKRQVIELLLGERFSGVDAVDRDASGRPSVDIEDAVSSAPLVQFLEQIFEWENLTYVLYPYFWADDSEWDNLQGLESPDPDYARFLRCGSARVVVSARPGYACPVEYFLCTGIPWTGYLAPAPDDPEYISVADEIQAQTSPPVDGTAVGPSWEVRLPTTLVYLDSDPTLPKTNDQADLPAPPT